MTLSPDASAHRTTVAGGASVERRDPHGTQAHARSMVCDKSERLDAPHSRLVLALHSLIAVLICVGVAAVWVQTEWPVGIVVTLMTAPLLAVFAWQWLLISGPSVEVGDDGLMVRPMRGDARLYPWGSVVEGS